MKRSLGGWILTLMVTSPVLAQVTFVNWETPTVHPIAMTPDGQSLLVANLPDNRLEVFSISIGVPVHVASVAVGLDPVTVRARSNSEAWVVNHISDSVSIVDLTTLNVIRTLDTADEPTDVVFAGNPTQRAFVTCSQANLVQVFDLVNLGAAPTDIAIDGEDPRAMDVSPDGNTVYVAVFESGNKTTILGGGGDMGTIGFPPNVVNDPTGPYGGQNPPPNDGANFNPPMNPGNPAPPRVGLIVRKNVSGQWMDDNNGDWTDFVTGPNADLSGRQPGWDLPDHDVAIIDANSLSVSYASGLMNICMSMAVNPVTGRVMVIGTDAINEIRFEPVLSGIFVRVNAAWFDSGTPNNVSITDLNSHLDYSTSTVSQNIRDMSIGDPRAIAWSGDGSRAYVAGLGSNNLIIVDGMGNRVGAAPTVEVGEGPAGLALDEDRNRLYVLNRFAATISVVDLNSETEIEEVSMFDPTPSAIKVGRKHQYDTHKNSGLGQLACASCHVDSRMDRLSWDLGDPAGTMRPFNQNCNLGASGPLGLPPCQPWHPMKGPMTTQTLQDIVAKEPLHWRGDRNGIEEFNGAFIGLLGDDNNLTPAEMQEYEDFLATITYPPNPFRNFDNTLPSNLPLPGHYTTGRFASAGQPLPNGNAVAALNNYRTGLLDANGLQCVSCHTLPTGMGSNLRLQGFSFTPFPTGPNGERHHSLVSVDGSTNVSIKIPQLRNIYEKAGFNTTQLSNRAGFGYLHDGSVDSIERFVAEPIFTVASDQEVADLVAFMLSFAGSDLPMGTTGNVFELLGPTGRDTPAAVGTQITVNSANQSSPGLISMLASMVSLANTPTSRVAMVAKGMQGSLQRGYVYTSANMMQSDRATETISVDNLRLAAVDGSEVTFTLVPSQSKNRIGIDRDVDGFYDRDELDDCSDPANAASTPNNVVITGDFDGDGLVNLQDYQSVHGCLSGPQSAVDLSCHCGADFDGDGDVDLSDAIDFIINFTGP